MRTLIDALCPGCGDAHADLWIDTAAPEYPWCARCRRPLERGHSAPAAHSDSYRGGIWIEHGLCHPDGTPRRYDSQSEIDREARKRGLRNIVDHQDDSTTTQRFV
jgi:hypothetical protein